MSESTNVAADKGGIQKPLPAWLSAGVIGLALGTGATIVVMHNYGYRMEKPEEKAQSAAQGGGGAGGPGMGGGMPGMGGGAGMMGGGGSGPMGGMMGMGGGGGGGGGARGKRTLTSLVGKLELLTRGDLHVELDAEQSSKIAAKLAAWDELENMTSDEAQSAVDELEALLTEGQKAALDSIGLPFGRPGGGGGGPGGGGGMMSAGGISMSGGPGGGPGGPGGADDDNPFRQESNQKRLRDLLTRLQPARGESSAP